MPLFPGKKNIGKNIETEEKAGKSKAQSLAIALSVARRKKPKKMANGGPVSAKTEERPMPGHEHMSGATPPKAIGGDHRTQAAGSKSIKPSEIDQDFVSEGKANIDNARTSEEMRMKGMSTDPKHINEDHDMDIADAKFAEGGQVDVEEHYGSIADAILAKSRKQRAMAKGGMVDDSQADLSRNADEDLNYEDQLSYAAARKENYAETPGLEDLTSPMDSNEHEPEHDEIDVHDHSIVSAIRKKSKKNKV